MLLAYLKTPILLQFMLNVSRSCPRISDLLRESGETHSIENASRWILYSVITTAQRFMKRHVLFPSFIVYFVVIVIDGFVKY